MTILYMGKDRVTIFYFKKYGVTIHHMKKIGDNSLYGKKVDDNSFNSPPGVTIIHMIPIIIGELIMIFSVLPTNLPIYQVLRGCMADPEGLCYLPLATVGWTSLQHTPAYQHPGGGDMS